MGAVALAGSLAWALLPFVMTGRARPAMAFVVRVLLFGLAASGLLLAVDGRYRDYPFLLFALPTVQFGLAARWAGFDVMPRLPEARVFALIAAVGSVIAWLLDWRNPQALGWALMAAVLAAAFARRRQGL